jgi:hypothetical protein
MIIIDICIAIVNKYNYNCINVVIIVIKYNLNIVNYYNNYNFSDFGKVGHIKIWNKIFKFNLKDFNSRFRF